MLLSKMGGFCLTIDKFQGIPVSLGSKDKACNTIDIKHSAKYINPKHYTPRKSSNCSLISNPKIDAFSWAQSLLFDEV